MKLLRRFGPLILLFVISVLLYVNTVGHQFVYDDSYFSNRTETLLYWSSIPKAFVESYIPNNPSAGFYRPLAIASFAFTFILFGTSPLAFHITNIILNGITVLGVFYLARHFKFSYVNAWIAALLFAVLPIHTEAVAFVKSRDEIFYGLFFIISLITFMKSEGNAKTFIVNFTVSQIAYLAALFSKEMAFTIPLICLLVLLYKPKSFQSLMLFAAGWAVMTTIYAGLRYQALENNFFGSYNTLYPGYEFYRAFPVTRFFTGLYLYALNLRAILLPYYLSATYGFAHIRPITGPLSSWLWIPGVFCVLGTAGILLYCVKKNKTRELFFLLGFIVMYLPISQIFAVMGDLIAERWMYTPSILLVLFIVSFTSRFVSQKIFFCTVSCIVVLFSVRTILRNPVWATNESIYTNMVQTAPESVHAQTAFANELLFQNKVDKAYEHAEMAEKIYTKYEPLELLRGRIAAKQKNYVLAFDLFNNARQIDSSDIALSRAMGIAYFDQGKYAETVKEYEFMFANSRAIYFDDVYVFASALIKLGKYEECLKVVMPFVNGQRRNSRAVFLTAVSYYKAGQTSVVDTIIWDPTLSRDQRLKQLESF